MACAQPSPDASSASPSCPGVRPFPIDLLFVPLLRRQAWGPRDRASRFKRLSKLFVCVSFALAQSWTAPARAQSSSSLASLHLEWPSVAGCPTEGHLRQMIRRTLSNATPRAYDIWARVTIEKQSNWQLRVMIDSAEGRGERFLEGESCAQVADALAVILAMLIDPEAAKAASSAGTTSSDDHAQDTARTALITAQVPTASVQLLPGSVMLKKPTPSWFGFGLGAVVDLGIGLTIDHAQGPVRFFALGNYWPLHRAALSSDQQRGANVSIGSVAISVGPRITRPPFELVPRLGATGYLVHATGYGVDQPLPDTIEWWSISAGSVFLWEVQSLFFLQAALDVHFPVTRPAARLDPGGDAFRPGPLGVQAHLGALCRY
jgi:hypothetical protein